MYRNRLHHLINHFAADFRTHDIHLWSVSVSDFEESHPIAVSHLAAERVSDFVIKTETMTNLEKQMKLKFNLMWELSGSNPMKIRKEILREMIDFFFDLSPND